MLSSASVGRFFSAYWFPYQAPIITIWYLICDLLGQGRQAGWEVSQVPGPLFGQGRVEGAAGRVTKSSLWAIPTHYHVSPLVGSCWGRGAIALLLLGTLSQALTELAQAAGTS